MRPDLTRGASPAPATPPPAVSGWRGRLAALSPAQRWWLTLAVILLAALAVRVWLLQRGGWMLDGDEATMGLTAHAIEEGERPIFFPGQAYMGAWQAYVAAPLFAIFGMSREAAKAVPLLASLGFIVTIALLGRRLYDARTALVAAGLAALPGVYLLSTTLRFSYPMIDVMALGTLLLWIVVGLVWRSDPPPTRHFITQVALLGLIAGFGFWMHSAIAMYAAPAALVLFLRWPRRSLFPGLPVALVGFVVGAAPVFQFARLYDYNTFDYLRGSDSDVAQRDLPGVARHLVIHILPRYLGNSVPWQDAALLPQLLVVIPTVIAGGSLIALNWRAAWEWVRFAPQRARPDSLLLVFAVTVVVAYLGSRFSIYALTYPGVDATGRYLAPLGTALPLMLAGLWHTAAGRTLDLAQPDAAEAFPPSWTARISGWRPAVRRFAVAIPVCVLLGTGATWLSTDAEQVFQSPYYRELPRDSTALVRVLDTNGIDAVWVDHWVGKPLMFDTEGRIAAADYVDLRLWGGIDRHSALSNRVFDARRTAFVEVVEPGTSRYYETLLMRVLMRRNIPFSVERVGSYVVVIPDAYLDPASVADELLNDRRLP